jgi:hypothetical protein
MFQGILPVSQGQNLAMPVLYVPYLLDSGEQRDEKRGGRLTR